MQAYSGRTAFTLPHRPKRQRPAALPILGVDGQPLSFTEKTTAASAHGFSSPHTPSLSSTPVSPAPTGSALLVSDSEMETESEAASPTDHRTSPHLAASHPSRTPSSHLLDGHLPLILDNLHHARQFDVPDVSEPELVAMIQRILQQCGSVPVGKLGSLLHNVMNNHSLPSMLKEKFGGLKRFLERHLDLFTIGVDHPFNPHVHLTAELQARGTGEGAAAGGYQGAEGQGGGLGPLEGVTRPNRSGHGGNRPNPRQPPQGSGAPQAQPGRGGGQAKAGPWGHHPAVATAAMAGRGGQGGAGLHALSPHSPPVPDHGQHGVAGHQAAMVRHPQAGGGAPHHRYQTGGQAVGAAGYQVVAQAGVGGGGGRMAHPRGFASTEGLNVTAPAFVSSYEGGESAVGGGGQQFPMFGGYEEYGGGVGAAGGPQSNGGGGPTASAYQSHHSRYKQ